MKLILVLIALGISSLAQNTYSDKKIDMHGGNNNNLGGYSSGSFRNSVIDMSILLDKNSSKKMPKQKIQTKK